MALIVKPNTFTAGATIVAAEHNSNFDTLYNLVNGSISNANVSGSAAIASTKLDLSAISQAIAMAAVLTMSKAFITTPVALSDGATPALDASLGNIFTLAAAGDRTIAVPSNPTEGQKIIIVHLASGGARTLALNSGTGGFSFGSDITALSQTASGKYDYIGCVYNTTANKWHVIAYVKGY